MCMSELSCFSRFVAQSDYMKYVTFGLQLGNDISPMSQSQRSWYSIKTYKLSRGSGERARYRIKPRCFTSRRAKSVVNPCVTLEKNEGPFDRVHGRYSGRIVNSKYASPILKLKRRYVLLSSKKCTWNYKNITLARLRTCEIESFQEKQKKLF